MTMEAGRTTSPAIRVTYAVFSTYAAGTHARLKKLCLNCEKCVVPNTGGPQADVYQAFV